jgi:hypothetical protein
LHRLEALCADSSAIDVPAPSVPPRPAPARAQPGGLGPAAGAVRLASLAALPVAGTLHPSTPGGWSSVGNYLVLPGRVKGASGARIPAGRPLTRPTVARSGDTVRPRWARSNRPTTPPRREARRSSSPNGSGRPGPANIREAVAPWPTSHRAPASRQGSGGRHQGVRPDASEVSHRQPRPTPTRPRPHPTQPARPAPTGWLVDRQLRHLRVHPGRRTPPRPGRAKGRPTPLPSLPPGRCLIPQGPNDDGNAIQGAAWACLFSVVLVLAVIGLVVVFRWWL